MNRNELLDFVELLEWFGIEADRDQDRNLELVTVSKWQKIVKLVPPKDKSDIEKEYGEVIDGKRLARLYVKQQEADLE